MKTPLLTYCLASERLVALRDDRFPDAAAFCSLEGKNYGATESAEVRICLVGQASSGGAMLCASHSVASDDLDEPFARLEAEYAAHVLADQTASA